jgi:hypothetical protein
MKIKTYVCFLLISFLYGCSVRYVERVPGFQPGYTDQQLGENTYQVKIGEAWPKDWPDLEKFAMYRAAEITESKNMRFFTVIDATTRTNTFYITNPGSSSTTGSVNVNGSSAYINTNTISTPTVTTPISGGWYILDFRIISDADVTSTKNVVDSQQIKKNYHFFIDSRR